MISTLQSNRVRRTYLGGGRIDAFCGGDRVFRGGSEYPKDAKGPVDPKDSTDPVGPKDSNSLPTPEDWMASTVTAFNGKVEIEGEGLGRLADGRLVKDVVGSLPVLVKLLDSDERLVIQAHPTVPFAKARMNSPVGKTECWYFLPGTAPDACVYLGFKPGITREKWVTAFNETNAVDGARRQLTAFDGSRQQSNNTLITWLHRIPVKPGDFVFVDGGVPHAIGGGCFMIELQEPSDLMVVAERFTPSGREIPEAKLHGGLGFEGMFDVYAYEGLTFDEICARYVRRGEAAPYPGRLAPQSPTGPRQILGPDLTDKFSEWLLKDGESLALPRDRGVAVVTEGVGDLNGVAVRKGDRLVFADERELKLTGKAEVVVCA